MSEIEKRNRRRGLLTSGGIHAAVFLILFFTIAWRAPDPPLPEYGIELNFGLDDQGGGNIQPDKPVGNQGERELTETSQQESTSESKENSDSEPNEPIVEKEVEQAVSKIEAPVATEVEKKKIVTAQEEKLSESNTKKVVESEYKKVVPKEGVAAETLKKGEEGSHGDDANKTGDKGNPEGKYDPNALYGTPGGGGGGTGMNLQMSGWAWADKPVMPELPDNENGRVVFEIECDDNGYITGITTVERSLSPRAEQLLKDVIQKNSLVRTSGGQVPKSSKGRITFFLRTK